MGLEMRCIQIVLTIMSQINDDNIAVISATLLGHKQNFTCTRKAFLNPV